MRIFSRRATMIKPLLPIHGRWQFYNSTYPEILDVAMKDGRIVRYVIDAKPVNICTGKHGWQVGKRVVGYKYKKRPSKRLTRSPGRQC